MYKFDALVYLATAAPDMDKAELYARMQLDKSRNPHNDHYKPRLRDPMEIVADFKLEFALMMLVKIENECKND